MRNWRSRQVQETGGTKKQKKTGHAVQSIAWAWAGHGPWRKPPPKQQNQPAVAVPDKVHFRKIPSLPLLGEDRH